MRALLARDVRADRVSRLSMRNLALHKNVPAPLVAIAGWLVPGAGYFLIAEKLRGFVIGFTILLLFIFGLLLAGVRVIDLPGFDDTGHKQFIELQRDPRNPQVIREIRNIEGRGRWLLLVHPISETANKPWIVPQVLMGPACLISGYFSLKVAMPDERTAPTTPGVPKSHGRLWEFGT